MSKKSAHLIKPPLFICCLVAIIGLLLHPQKGSAQQWQLVLPVYPTADAFVAGYSVADYGATGDGVTDVTAIFQNLIDLLGDAGGGTLFVPSGKYVISGNLLLPRGVILRGEWQKPVKGQPVQGTILMVYAGRGDEDAAAFITMQPTAGVQDLSIWYPEQDPDDITPYPPAILYGQTGYWGNDFCNADNVTLVNAYTGLVVSRVNGGGCPMINGLYGTPLSRGIEIDNIADVGHLENISFSPDYWAGSGLPGSPTPNSAYKTWIRNNGTGIVMRRNDWSYTSFVSIDGYKTGFYAGPSIASPGSVPNGQNYQFDISNCQTGILCDVVNTVGIMFSHMNITGCERGLKVSGGPSTEGAVQIYASSIQGSDNAIFTDSSCLANIIVERSTILGSGVMVNGGTFTASGNQFNNAGPQITIGDHARALITGNTYQNVRQIVNNSRYVSKIDDGPITLGPLPQFPDNYSELKRNQKPARQAIYIVTASPFNAVPDGITDNTTAVQNALTQAGNDGGGVVFLPPGKYKFNGHLSIPSGVELKGATDDFAAPKGQGAILEPYADKGNPSGNPFIIMAASSGIRGLTINYPEQLASNIPNVPAYPYSIQARGDNIYIVNVGLRAVYNGIDLFSYKCDEHFINNLSGHVFNNAIRVGGGTTGGLIAHCQFNTGDYANGAESKWGSWPNSPTDGTEAAYDYNMGHTDFLKLGNCSDETLYNNFVFGARNGLMLISDGGSGPSGISYGMGVDGAKNCIKYEAIGSEGFNMYNSQLVALGPDTSNSFIQTAPAFNGTAYLINTDFWGAAGKAIVDSGQGSLNLETTHFQHGNSGTVRFITETSTGHISIKNSDIPHNDHMLYSGTESSLSAESTVMDTNGIDTAQLQVYKNVLSTSWEVSLNGALSRIGWQAWANVNTTHNEVQKALDSIPSTRWSTSGPQVPGQVFGVDMINHYTLNAIVFDQGTSAGDYPRGYEVYVGTDSSNFGTPVATGTGTQGMTLITFPETEARYIKIVQTGSTGGYWSIHELYGFGTGDSVITLPRGGWQAWANVNSSNSEVQKALDSTLSTRWSTGGPQTPGQVFGVDMQKDYKVRSVILDHTPSQNDYPRGFELYVATDSSNWGEPVATGVGTSSKTQIAFPEVTGRYIKIVQTGSVGSYWSIHEFYAQGMELPETLPVAFKSIRATFRPGSLPKVHLNWHVGMEDGITTYKVERSLDGIHFTLVGTLSAVRSQAYTYIDENLPAEKLYYRIKAVNTNGTVTPSKVATVDLVNMSLDNITVFPNPATGSVLNLKFNNKTGKALYQLNLYKSDGTELYHSMLNKTAGKRVYQIKIGPSLMPGIYILKITNRSTGVSTNMKIQFMH